MKRILQTIDSASNKSEIIKEGTGPLNRATAAESIAMQHYAEPVKKTITSPVLNVAESAVPSMIGKYFKAVEEELKESAQRGNLRARQLAERVTSKLNELSTDTLSAYKKAAAADEKWVTENDLAIKKFPTSCITPDQMIEWHIKENV